MKKLKQFDKKKITLEELQQLYHLESYGLLYDKVKELMDKELIEPVKSSPLNGKRPALYQRYHVVKKPQDTGEYKKELQYQISPKLDISYYLSHIKQYEQDREDILLLNEYVKRCTGSEKYVALNERSFEIWGREKYLKEEGGKTLLKRLGLSLIDLRVYETVVPLAYYVHHKHTPQNILIIENKDTFYSIRKHLMESSSELFGVTIGTLIYGGGKQIIKAFLPFMELGEAYLKEVHNNFWYFGDLDYEGIGIYESLVEDLGGKYEVKVFRQAYMKMTTKSCGMSMELPKMKERQNKVDGQVFWESFEPDEVERMKVILEEGRYIPQEILNQLDF